MMVVMMMKIDVHRIDLLLLRSLALPTTLLRSHGHIRRSIHIELLRILLVLFSFIHLIWWLRLSILVQILMLKSLMNIRLTHNMNFWSSRDCRARIWINWANSSVWAPSILNHLLDFILFWCIYSIVLFRDIHDASIWFLWKPWSFRSNCMHLNLISF